MDYKESINLRVKSFELARGLLEFVDLPDILEASETIYNYLANNKINSSADEKRI